MKSPERREELLRLVRSRGYVNVSEAAQELAVDTSTIRRDLTRLHQLGLIERSHGGATQTRDEAEVPYDVKLSRLVGEKRAIGTLTASLIPDGSALILDSGSTSLAVARALADHQGLTVITPDIRVAAELIGHPDMRLIVLGGEALPRTTTVISQEAVESMRRYHVDIAVMGTDAVDPVSATNMNGTVVPLKRAMIGAAQRSILVVDSSKLGARKLVTVAPVQDFTEIVTDDRVSQEALTSYPIPARQATVSAEGQG